MLRTGPATALSVVIPVAAVHEEVKKRARQEQKPGQGPQEMRPVLGPQKEPGNGQKCDEPDP